MNWTKAEVEGVGVVLDDEILKQMKEESEASRSSLMVNLLIAKGAWIGAYFLLGFLALLIKEIFDLKGEGLIVTGLLVMAGALVLHRQSKNVFSEHFALSLSIGGHLGLYGGIGWMAESVLTPAIFSVPVAALGYVLYRRPDHRFISVFGSCALLTMAFRFEGFIWGLPVLTAIQVGIGCLVLLNYWQREDTRPLAASLLLAPLLTVACVHDGWLFRSSQHLYFPQILSAPLGVAWLALLLCLSRKRLSVALQFGLVVLTLGLVALGSSGIISALILIVAGKLRSPWLIRYGVCALGVAIVETYYNMDRSLLYKSVSMLGVSGILGTLAFLFWKNGRVEERIESGHHLTSLSKVGWLAPVLGLVWIVGGLSYIVVQKEGTLKTGQTLYLELAPRDPRSIMQGDYMVLTYDLVRNRKLAKGSALDGRMVLKLDERKVGNFSRWDDGSALEENEIFLRYRRRNERIRLGAESFFFEEGKRKLYDVARFSLLKVGADGESVLAGLYTESLDPILPNEKESEAK